MASLNRSTLRRLKNLQQVPAVWEGDRRVLSKAAVQEDDLDLEMGDECIIWVDGSQGVVRAMDMVSSDIGMEAVVRTFLRAMEHPQSPTPAVRPQKIVVKDREIQFFLRGALQELGITIEYVPDLPLIDEIFRGLQEIAENRPPQLPPRYASTLTQKAYDIWKDAPWHYLGEHQIIAIELNCFDVETLYISTLGKLGMDYGILMYRSLESLRQFRERIVEQDPFDNLEEAFLTQDCLFVTFERADLDLEEEDDDDIDLESLPISEIQPNFGNLHPLEGLRSVLYDEEAAAVLLALESLHRFLQSSRSKLKNYQFPSITRKYQLALPDQETDSSTPEKIAVKISTLPDLAEELSDMMAEAQVDEALDGEAEEEFDINLQVPVLQDDLIPPKTLLSLGVMPWKTTEYLRENTQFHQGPDREVPQQGDGLPVILLQTTKPKAKTLIQRLQALGGLTGICFNPGEDPTAGYHYDLGILKTEDGELHLLGEFLEDDPVHQQARKKWEQRCQKTKGWCGLIIAMGATGASKGEPRFKDMMALLEVRSLSPEDLGLGSLKLMPLA